MTSKRQTASEDPRVAFRQLTDEYRDDPQVQLPTASDKSRPRFGDNGLKVNGHIFAMLVDDHLVVKLPRGRVDELVDERTGTRFDPRHDGRVMKEWLSVDHSRSGIWSALARESHRFVGSKG